MASLFNTRISDTYPGLIKTIDNAAITATLKEITDGNGTGTGLFINTAGDFKVNSILEFGSLKDTAENIIITKFVDAADGISNNDNDTTIPTTAAIVDYVAAQITIEDLDFIGDSGTGQIDLDSQIFDIGGTSNEITTIASGQSLTISLDSTGVNLPDNSTAITQTAGDNSTKIATTSYVDTLDAASDLDITDGTNTGDINLNTQSLSILGTTNEIDTVVSGQGVTIGLPSTINTNLVGNVTGNVTGNLIGDVTGDVTGDLTGNVTSTSVLADGVTATTQSSSDDSTKVATTAYVKGLNNASDLDFKGDNGTFGDVNLNTQRFDILGTTNQITTVSSGQSLTIGLPTNVTVSGIVNATTFNGNLTGNVTGDLTGNSVGTHTGGVIGNVTGNVTGNLTGNSDTATAWETARDLSLTGQATGTISSVDGTNNVSGAVTLDNNSVTAKVLTGLTSPSASSVLASDTILQGIGKLQSQVNGLAGGLRFMGSWDASTNSPVLGSGGGEAAAGTTTGVQANKLIDSTQNFTSTVTVGDQVVNQVDGQTALVSGIDSNTTLSLDTDIMISGEDYTIDNSPFITQGHYYVVSVGGTTSLNGISSWTIGDWVIAGANNEWTKLDHSQVDGTGTVGNLTKWSGTQIISDSIVSESGTAITVDGSLSTNTNLSSTGDFAVNTNKFTVAAASGDTAFAGDLAINTNKFTVDATTGNVAVAGTGSFAGDVTINTGELYVTADSGINTSAKFESGAGSTINYLQLLPNGASDTNSGYIGYDNSNNLKLFTQNTLAVTLDASQNSTFAGSVGIGGNAASNGYMVDITPTGGNIIRSSRGTSVFGSYQSNNSDVYLGTISNNTFKIITNDTTAITVSNSQNATFAGAVSTGGYLTLNSGDNIPRLIFNGSGDDFFLSNTANYFGLYNNTDSRWDIQVDGAGNSTFAGEISSSDDININNGKLVVNHTSAEVRIKSTSDTGESYINFSDSSDINPGQIYYGHSNNNMVFRTNDSEKMRITDAGDITVSGGDLFLNSGTNYTDKGVVYFSNERSAIISDIVSGTANGDTSLDFQTRVNGSRASAIFIDEFRSVNIPAYADGIKLKITSSAGANNNIIEIGQLGSDGFLDVSSAGGGIISHLSGYSGYESYFLSDVGIGVANASDYWANANNLVVGNLGTVSGITIATDGNLVGSLVFADGTGAGDNTRGAVQYNHSVDSMYFRVNNDTKMYINSAGQLSLGTPNVYSPTGGGVTEVTIKHDSNDRVNTVITNQNSGGSAGAALVLATYGQDWIIESESLAAGGALTFSRGSSQYFEINGAGQGYFSGGVRVGGLYITALQGNSQLTNASSSSGSNPSYIGQGLISVTISDAKAKENFEDVKENECLNQVQSLAKYVKKFDWIDEDWKKEKGRTIGMVAQEVNEEFPELVHSPKNYEDEGWAIRYQEIVPTLIKSIQELKAEVDLLKQECKCKN